MFSISPGPKKAAARAAFPKAQAIRAPVRQTPPNAGIQRARMRRRSAKKLPPLKKLPKFAQFRRACAQSLISA
jgi:hypothetical protein